MRFGWGFVGVFSSRLFFASTHLTLPDRLIFFFAPDDEGFLESRMTPRECRMTAFLGHYFLRSR
jgi:hypothetical protein